MVSCSFCNKECRASDSKPYPNSKSKDMIHNKCSIKKNLADKMKSAKGSGGVSKSDQPATHRSNFADVVDRQRNSVASILDRVNKEQSELDKAAHERRLGRLIEDRASLSIAQKDPKSSGGQFFFDLKAGIAKPHEKRRFLHHKNLKEMGARYDDQGFQQETFGRAYDHSGKAIGLGDSSDVSGDDSDSDTKVKSGDGHRANVSDIRTLKKPRITVDETNPCWFCLASPNVEKHLIIAIGDHCYLTLAKGGLRDDHLLILPIEHIQCLNDSKGNSGELLEELEKFKNSLVHYFRKRSCGVVFFERNYRSVHWQLQAVPIPLEIIDSVEQSIKSVSQTLFKDLKYIDVPRACSLYDMIPPGKPYIYWQLEPGESRFVAQIELGKGSPSFPVQFGRVVLADKTILDCHDKVDWKACVKTKEQYIDLVASFKEGYREFEIS